MKIQSFGLLAFTVLFCSTAFATPGDIGCTTQYEDQTVDLLLGIDAHGQTTPSLIEISYGGELLFTSTEVEESLVNVGTKEEPFLNTLWTANDEESTATVRVPEQSGDNGEFIVILNVVTDSGLFSVSELEMTCQR